VALTERGSGILGRLVPPVTELEERMLADFSATARTEIRGALTAMRSALEATRPPE